MPALLRTSVPTLMAACAALETAPTAATTTPAPAAAADLAAAKRLEVAASALASPIERPTPSVCAATTGPPAPCPERRLRTPPYDAIEARIAAPLEVPGSTKASNRKTMNGQSAPIR